MKYPYYGQSRNSRIIVYFIKKQTGQVVAFPTATDSKGSWSKDWNERAFDNITDTHIIKKLNKKRLLLNV